MKLITKKIDAIRSGGDKVTLRDGPGGKTLGHCVVSNNFKKDTHGAFLLIEDGGSAVGFLIVRKGTEMPEVLVSGE